MEKEICDYYEPISRKDKICKHFIGNKNNKRELSGCRNKCSIIDCSELMKHDSYRRSKGAIKRR